MFLQLIRDVVGLSSKCTSSHWENKYKKLIDHAVKGQFDALKDFAMYRVEKRIRSQECIIPLHLC